MGKGIGCLINYVLIKQVSPTEDFGMQNLSALKAVIAQPSQKVFETELYPMLYNKAAILFEMTIKKHCFYNRNKRTVVIGLYVFLRKNGFCLVTSNKEIADFTVEVAVQEGNDVGLLKKSHSGLKRIAKK